MRMPAFKQDSFEFITIVNHCSRFVNDKASFLLFSGSQYQHCIPERKEPVFHVYCLIVGLKHHFAARQRGNKHEQGAFRQVEVGYECVGYLESVTGVDEYLRVVGHRMDYTVLVRDAFKRAAGGCPDGKNSDRKSVV